MEHNRFLFGAVAGLFLLQACADVSGGGGSTVGSGPGATTGGAATGAGASGQGGQGATAAGGSAGGGGGGQAGGGGGVDSCIDAGPGEPNDSEPNATLVVAPIDDCDGIANHFQTVKGTVDGPNDADWYIFDQTADKIGCSVDPGVKWSQGAGSPLEVCVYLECISGTPNFTCPNGTTQDSIVGGPDGCCGQAQAGFNIDAKCNGGAGNDDLFRVRMQVSETSPAADACTDYNLTYHL